MPSLFIDKGACQEIDTRLKMPLVAETLNIVGHHISTGKPRLFRSKMDILMYFIKIWNFCYKCVNLWALFRYFVRYIYLYLDIFLLLVTLADAS